MLCLSASLWIFSGSKVAVSGRCYACRPACEFSQVLKWLFLADATPVGQLARLLSHALHWWLQELHAEVGGAVQRGKGDQYSGYRRQVGTRAIYRAGESQWCCGGRWQWTLRGRANEWPAWSAERWSMLTFLGESSSGCLFGFYMHL